MHHVLAEEMIAPSSNQLRPKPATVNLRSLAWLCLVAGLGVGCSQSNISATPGVLLRVLADRRAACEDLGSEAAGAWKSAINQQGSAEVALLLIRSTNENELRIARIEKRKKQVAALFSDLGEHSKPEIKSLLLDIASQVESLCSIALEPAGFSLMTFNGKRSELRVELDQATARASLLIPSAPTDGRLALLDAEVRSEQQMLEEVQARVEKDRAAEMQAKEEAAAAEKRTEQEAAAARRKADQVAAAARNRAEQEAADIAQERQAEADRRREAEYAAQSQRDAEIRAQNQPLGTWWDDQTGLLWTPNDNGSAFSWEQAQSYCGSLTLGGSDNWRLPSISELTGLFGGVSSRRFRTRGDVELTERLVWSGDLNADAPSGAWAFSFSSAEQHWTNRGGSAQSRALCVRHPGN